MSSVWFSSERLLGTSLDTGTSQVSSLSSELLTAEERCYFKFGSKRHTFLLSFIVCVCVCVLYQIPAFSILSTLCEIMATISPNAHDDNSSCDVLLDLDISTIVAI